jgi:hypothetical protein
MKSDRASARHSPSQELLMGQSALCTITLVPWGIEIWRDCFSDYLDGLFRNFPIGQQFTNTSASGPLYDPKNGGS